MDAKEMRKRCMHLSLAPIEKLDFNEDEESLSVLYENRWLRILLVKCKGFPEQFSIDVELSMPAIEENNCFDASLMLANSVQHLQYIQRLLQLGFLLEVVGQDWLWIASKSFDETPSLEIFEYLIPPLSREI